MENGECGEPRGIVKNARRIWVMTSAKQQPLWRIFSMHSPSIRMALRRIDPSPNSRNPMTIAHHTACNFSPCFVRDEMMTQLHKQNGVVGICIFSLFGQ